MNEDRVGITLRGPLAHEVRAMVGPYGDSTKDVVKFILRHWLSQHGAQVAHRREEYARFLQAKKEQA